MPPKVLSHFKKVDPVLFRVIKEVGQMQNLRNRRGDDYFLDLVDAIISQQLSGRVAEVIFERFKNLFSQKEILPIHVLKLKDESIRAIGISYPKIKYIKDLASKVNGGELKLNSMKGWEDEEVITKLTAVKGIGRWTAEMFLLFTLKREDIFSHGDLGLNNAIAKIYSLKKPSEKTVEKIVSKWSPYKSYASRILWKSLDNR